MAHEIFYIDGATGLGERQGNQWPYGNRFSFPAGDYGDMYNPHILLNRGRFYNHAVQGDYEAWWQEVILSSRIRSRTGYPWIMAGGWTARGDPSRDWLVPLVPYKVKYHYYDPSYMYAYVTSPVVSKDGEIELPLGEYGYPYVEGTGVFVSPIGKQYRWWEMRYYSHSSNAVCELRIDGTGARTDGFEGPHGLGVPVASEVPLNAAQMNLLDYFYWSEYPINDDMYIAFADTEEELPEWGNKTCEPLYVLGAGTDQDCTPRGPSNFASVEFPVNDVLYVSAVADSEKDCYSYSNLETDRDRDIDGLKVTARARKNNPADTKIRCYCRVSGTNYYGDTYYLGPEWREYIHIWELNPNTGSAWTAAEINNTQYDFERVA